MREQFCVLVWRTRYIPLGARLITLGRCIGWRGREWQTRRSIQNLAFLRRELTEAPRLNLPLTNVRGHSPKRLNRIPHRLPAVRRQTVELASYPPKLLLLLRSEVFPGFHTAQNLLLPVRRHAVEALQALFILLLPIAWEMSECRIIFQRATLLIGRHFPMLVQPLT